MKNSLKLVANNSCGTIAWGSVLPTVKLSDDLSKALLNVCETTLSMFPLSAEGTVSTPTWDEVQSLMNSLLPSPSELYTEDFFKKPLFPVVTLHDISVFYGYCLSGTEAMNSIGIPIQNQENKPRFTYYLPRSWNAITILLRASHRRTKLTVGFWMKEVVL